MRKLALSLVLSASFGCAKSPAGAVDAAAAPDLGPSNALVAMRPYDLVVPARADGKTPLPLVVLLHGRGANATLQNLIFGLSDLVDTAGFLLALPNGTIDPATGQRFWNATDACCDFQHTGVDDVAYLDALIDDVSAHYPVDKKRVFLTGHSNGAFMSHRYACDRAARVAAFFALAGDDWLDDSRCAPTEPVAALQVHGDADTVVPYAGGMASIGGGAIPSARASVAGWAKKNGCPASPTTMGAPQDLDVTAPGAETSVEIWTGCQPGGAAQLWTMHGVGHVPNFRHPDWENAIWAWMSAHPKP
jgi:polyhydroxybutyrate depolymerase